MEGITVWSHGRAGGLAVAGVAAALLVVGCRGASVTVAASPVAATTPTGPVVALGDSYTAGALMPLDTQATPVGCLRSTEAYPVLVARDLGVNLVDVACASAGVSAMAGAQVTNIGTNSAQLGALAPDDRMVLLSLGGDDLGFMPGLQECMKLSFGDPWGAPCEAYYGGQFDAKVTAEAPKVTQVLAEIAARAPLARIVLVGYPDLFPQSGGCWPRVPITDGDLAYLNGIELRLNAMLAADAKAAGVTFVNTYTPTIGRDFCQPESIRDVEGVIPGSLAYPFHPNERGQKAIAAAVLQALRT
jgi:lysophospholipase L1-like esterase